MAEQKTNVMRILEQKKIKYTPHEYEHDGGPVDGVSVAKLIGREPGCVFKTLVTVGASGQNYVFVIPVDRELALRKAARVLGEKSISMLHVSKLTALTGYVRGGCSPIGMKKPFKTVFDASAMTQETIIVSAGRIGAQVECAPGELTALVKGVYADICD